MSQSVRSLYVANLQEAVMPEAPDAAAFDDELRRSCATPPGSVFSPRFFAAWSEEDVIPWKGHLLRLLLSEKRLPVAIPYFEIGRKPLRELVATALQKKARSGREAALECADELLSGHGATIQFVIILQAIDIKGLGNFPELAKFYLPVVRREMEAYQNAALAIYSGHPCPIDRWS